MSVRKFAASHWAPWRRQGRLIGRRPVRIALVIGIAASALAFTASSAQAYTYQWQFQNWATGRCLDSNAAGDVYTSPCQRGNNWQTWTVEGTPQSIGGDEVYLENVATGRVLNYFNGDGWVSTQTSYYYAKGYAVGPNWSNVHFTHYTPFDQSVCLDSNASGQAYNLVCSGNANQTWRKW
jgi:hypothetical protein